MQSPEHLFDRVAALGENRQFDAAKKALKQLAEAARQSPKDRDTVLCLARAAYSLGASARSAGKTELTHTTLVLLDKLARKYPADEDMVLEWAQAAFDHLAEYADHGNTKEADALFRALNEHAARFPAGTDLRTLKAGACFNLATCLGRTGNPDQARTIYDTLSTDNAAHPEDPDLARLRARTAINLAVAFADKNDLYTAWQLHADALSLHRTHDFGRDMKSALKDLEKYLDQKGKDMECGRNLTIR